MWFHGRIGFGFQTPVVSLWVTGKSPIQDDKELVPGRKTSTFGVDSAQPNIYLKWYASDF